MTMRQFELLEPLQPGRSAPAKLLSWNGQKYVRTGQEVVMHDFVGIQGERGDRFYGFLSPESGRWEAVGGLYERESSWLPT